jgi:hypothetical protein
MIKPKNGWFGFIWIGAIVCFTGGGILFILGDIFLLSRDNASLNHLSSPSDVTEEIKRNFERIAIPTITERWSDRLPRDEMRVVLTGALLSSHGRDEGTDVLLLRHTEALYLCEIRPLIPAISDPSTDGPMSHEESDRRRTVCWKLS